MLRNRRIEIRVAKEADKDPNQPPVEKLDITATVADVTDAVVTGTVKIIGSYMAADTLRKILVSRLS